LPEPADLSQLGFDSADLAKMPDLAEIAKMFGWVDVSSLPSPHVDPVLEDLVARAVGVPLNISSTPASKWGQASTNRVLRSLGVSTRRAIVLSGFGDEGSPVVSVVAVPGISGPRLTEVFGPSQERAPGYRYRTEIIGGEAARLEHGTLPSASHPGTDEPWLGGWLTVDGCLVSFSGSMLSEESVNTTIIRLRDALRNQAPRQATP
jgi:hypothetical protein